MKDKITYCYLCDEPILRLKDFSKEHYVPKSRTNPSIWMQPYNIKPAIKIVNNIKGNLLPCEWEDRKSYLIYKALYSYKLDRFEKGLLETILDKFETQLKQDVCKKCILNKLKKCNSR